jgi:hypothetical protein
MDPGSKSLGVAILDYDKDGWPDMFVANDTQPNKLYHNSGHGTFVETAVSAGVAFNEEGKVRGGMGTDVADIDGSGYRVSSSGTFPMRCSGSSVIRGKRRVSSLMRRRLALLLSGSLEHIWSSSHLFVFSLSAVAYLLFSILRFHRMGCPDFV